MDWQGDVLNHALSVIQAIVLAYLAFATSRLHSNVRRERRERAEGPAPDTEDRRDHG